MGYQLTYFKYIPHGMANGYLVYGYLRKVNEVFSRKVDSILSALGLENLEMFKDYVTKILPRTTKFCASDLEEWVKISIKARNVASCPFPVTEDDELEMYKSALL